MTTFDFPTRVRAGSLLLALLAVVSSLQTLRHIRWASPGNISAFEAHLRAIRRDLPSHGQVGYIADELETTDKAAIFNRFHEFCLTQYALAPLIVIDSGEAILGTELRPHNAGAPQYSLVVGNFHRPLPPERIANLDLVLVKDYREGIMLFRRAGK